MPYASLRDFIARLEQAGRLVRVKAAVSPVLEMTEIQTRLLAEKGPAVLFENVTGFDMPVLVNLFGTVRRSHRHGPQAHQLRAVSETLAFLPPARAAGRLRRRSTCCRCCAR